MPTISVKKPFTVLVGIILVLVLGVVAFTKMTTDLLPNMDLPYMVVYATDPGASPESVEGEVTKPLESALGSTTGLKNITSTSNENVGIVVLEFEQGTDMNAVSIEMRQSAGKFRYTGHDADHAGYAAGACGKRRRRRQRCQRGVAVCQR